MAEIHVEPKKQTSNSSWIWIVLVLLVVAAVVYYLLTRDNTADDTTVEPGTPTSYIGTPVTGHSHTLYL